MRWFRCKMMSRSYWIVAVSAALTILYTINLAMPKAMPSEVVSAIAYITILSITTASFHQALKVSGWGFRDRLMRAFSMAVIGFALWFAAKLLNAIYTVIVGVEPPYPSQIDAIWVLGCIFLILGLWSYTSKFKILWREAAEPLKHLITLTPVAVFFTVTMISLAAVNPFKLINVDPLEASMDFTYTILDSILLSLAILNLLLFRRGILGRVWALISGGVALGMLLDLLSLQGFMETWYYWGHPVEILAIWGFTLAALGANLYAETFRPSKQETGNYASTSSRKIKRY